MVKKSRKSKAVGVQYKELDVEVEGMNTDTQVRNHLSPKGLVGFLFLRHIL